MSNGSRGSPVRPWPWARIQTAAPLAMKTAAEVLRPPARESRGYASADMGRDPEDAVEVNGPSTASDGCLSTGGGAAA